jgi:hypothetical protein
MPEEMNLWENFYETHEDMGVVDRLGAEVTCFYLPH